MSLGYFTAVISSITDLLPVSFQLENGVGAANQVQDEAEILDNQAGTEEDNDDNVSEISGLSDISITGAGRWHPMKGLLASVLPSYF